MTQDELNDLFPFTNTEKELIKGVNAPSTQLIEAGKSRVDIYIMRKNIRSNNILSGALIVATVLLVIASFIQSCSNRDTYIVTNQDTLTTEPFNK